MLSLPSKVLIPSLNQSFCIDRNGFPMFTQQFPLSFTFGEEPDYLYQGRQSLYRFMPESPLARSQQHDIVRQIHLGVRPSETTRQCSRCSYQSLLRNIAKSDTMKAWEQRWAKHCCVVDTGNSPNDKSITKAEVCGHFKNADDEMIAMGVTIQILE